MNWLAWEQHKKQFFVLGIFLGVFAAILVPGELYLNPIVQHVVSVCGKPDAAADCLQRQVSSFDIGLFFAVSYIARYAMLGIPFVLGLFWGVPLVASEYINGTNKLVWTRSISRRRWLIVKLLWVLAATVIFVAAFTLIATFWSQVSSATYVGNTINDSGAQVSDRFSSTTFDTMGLAPAAYALFGVALGVAFGVWFKRIITALALTLGVFLVLQVAVPLLIRPYYEAPKTISVALEPDGNNMGNIPPIPTGIGQAWILGGTVVNNQGRVLSYGDPPATCANALQDSSPSQGAKCLIGLGYHWDIRYQPAYRYWDFQRIEAALYLLLSILPVSVIYRLVLKRDA